MKILFLRVGIDTGCGGRLSPLFGSHDFEYVPIPESAQLIDGKGIRYSELRGRHGGTLECYSGSTGFAHYDPEFETYTYGEPSEPKRTQLLRLSKNDVLVFYSGFHGEAIRKGTCFVIGYFTILDVHSVPKVELWPPLSLAHLHRNAHFRRKKPEPSLVIVEGNPIKSRLFKRAIQLSDEKQAVLSKLQDVIGFGGSVKRAVGRWVPHTHTQMAWDWLSVNSS